MGPEIPATTQEQIRELKDALAALVDADMCCRTTRDIETKQLQQELASLVGANALPQPLQYTAENSGQFDEQTYGAGLKVTVRRPAKEPHLAVIEFSFDVECGNDSMLLIYEPDPEGWRQSLRWQSGDYAEISGAFGDFFEYLVIPNATPNQWVVAVGHGHPWCTSRWSALDVDVIAPSRGALPQHVLFHKEDGYVRETNPVMKATSRGFELRFEKECIDVGIMTRPGIYRYQVDGDQVHRIQP